MPDSSTAIPSAVCGVEGSFPDAIWCPVFPLKSFQQTGLDALSTLSFHNGTISCLLFEIYHSGETIPADGFSAAAEGRGLHRYRRGADGTEL